MTSYVLPLEAIGLLLTAAAIGAVIIAMQEPGRKTSILPRSDAEPPKYKNLEAITR
jgi:hypothetical protein